MRNVKNITTALALATSLLLAMPAPALAANRGTDRPAQGLQEGDRDRGIGPIERVLRAIRHLVSVALDQPTNPHP
jgi:hypothetical protein